MAIAMVVGGTTRTAKIEVVLVRVLLLVPGISPPHRVLERKIWM
jgi:hypothetical protein